MDLLKNIKPQRTQRAQSFFWFGLLILIVVVHDCCLVSPRLKIFNHKEHKEHKVFFGLV